MRPCSNEQTPVKTSGRSLIPKPYRGFEYKQQMWPFPLYVAPQEIFRREHHSTSEDFQDYLVSLDRLIDMRASTILVKYQVRDIKRSLSVEKGRVFDCIVKKMDHLSNEVIEFDGYCDFLDVDFPKCGEEEAYSFLIQRCEDHIYTYKRLKDFMEKQLIGQSSCVSEIDVDEILHDINDVEIECLDNNNEDYSEEDDEDYSLLEDVD